MPAKITTNALRALRRSSSTSSFADPSLHQQPPPPLHRHFSSVPPKQQLYTAQLNDRGFISLEGKNCYKLLQGLVTNDVRRLEDQMQRRAQVDASRDAEFEKAFYCAFLNPQGRLIASTFLHAQPEIQTDAGAEPRPPSVLLDCPFDNLSTLTSFIKRFMLRSGVKFRDATQEWEAWAIWSGNGSEQDERAISEAATVAFREGSSSRQGTSKILEDSRTPHMGWRLLSNRGYRSEFLEALWSKHGAEKASEPTYIRHRLMQGVPDGTAELMENHTMPLEANIDFLGGIDYKKGCYIGQELTSRTHHLGVVRKRIMPVRIIPSSSNEQSRQPPDLGQVRVLPATPTQREGGANSSRSKPAGNVLAVSEDPDADGAYIGVAMLRLQHVIRALEAGQEDPAQQLELPQSDGKAAWKVLPTWPEWWPAGVKDKILTADPLVSD